MNRNVGVVDKVLRIATGVVILELTSLGLVASWGYLGLLLVLTGVARWCPLYATLRMDSLRRPPDAVPAIRRIAAGVDAAQADGRWRA